MQCRQQKRYAFRNERTIYSRKCDKTGQDLVSMFPPGTRFLVYANAEWWKDDFDAIVYGRGIEWNKGIFDQMYDLQKVVPRTHTANFSDDTLENSVYVNCAGNMKNCYLVFGAINDENCSYSAYTNESYGCMDCFFCLKSNGCYECVDIDQCYNLFFSQGSQLCRDSAFLYDCRSVSDSIACVGLRQKQYCFLNKQLSKEEFLKVKAGLFTGSYEKIQAMRRRFESLKAGYPRKFVSGEKNEESSGDFLWNTKNCKNCFDTYDVQDSKNCTWFAQSKDCQEVFAWGNMELCYEVVSGGEQAYHSAFTLISYGCKYSYYVDHCMNCTNCFACVGLKNKQYCIFNKQYTKEQYEELVPKLIELMQRPSSDAQLPEWGQFFPNVYSPYGYNETVAQEYFPLTREEALGIAKPQSVDPVETPRHGRASLHGPFNWSEYEAPLPVMEKAITAEQMKKLPDNIDDIPDEIVNWALTCEVSGKLFKIIKPELRFYRENRLPIPRKHHDQRHRDRMLLRNPRTLWPRQCDCTDPQHQQHTERCSVSFETTYAPSRSEKVYCEGCYLKTMY